jgi:hypothetical protein
VGVSGGFSKIYGGLPLETPLADLKKVVWTDISPEIKRPPHPKKVRPP